MASNPLKIKILGCGTSVGVPTLGRAGWGACDPLEPKNKRQRCALLVQTATTTLLVDAGPDIKNQLLPHQLARIDGLLITHTHADHIAGLDELRVFYWPDQVKIPVYATSIHATDIKSRMPYMFARDEASPSYFIPPLEHVEIEANQAFEIGDIAVQTLYQEHGRQFSLGFIFDNLCGYSTDVKAMPEVNFEKLAGIELWIVESLRAAEHSAHAHFDLSFSWIDRVKPKRAVLTHLGLEADYRQLLALCPKGTEPAFDGQCFVLERGDSEIT